MLKEIQTWYKIKILVHTFCLIVIITFKYNINYININNNKMKYKIVLLES